MLSLQHILLTLLVVLIVFGAGKLPKVMGDLGKGIRNFKDELKGENKNEEVKELEDSDQNHQNRN
jgi:sec-independent protein translocase protein TatA